MIDLKVVVILLILALDVGFVLGAAWARLHADRAEPVRAVDDIATRRAKVTSASWDRRKRAA